MPEAVLMAIFYLTREAVQLATLPAQSRVEKLGASINDVVSRRIPIWV